MSEFDLKPGDNEQPKNKADDKQKPQPEKKPARDFEIDTKDNGAGKGGNLTKVLTVTGALAGVAVAGYLGLGMLGGSSGVAGSELNKALYSVAGGEAAYEKLLDDISYIQDWQKEEKLERKALLRTFENLSADKANLTLRSTAKDHVFAERAKTFLSEDHEFQERAILDTIDERFGDTLREMAGGAPSSAPIYEVLKDAYAESAGITGFSGIRQREQSESWSPGLLLRSIAGEIEDASLSDQFKHIKRQIEQEMVFIDSWESGDHIDAHGVLSTTYPSAKLAEAPPERYKPTLLTVPGVENMVARVYEQDGYDRTNFTEIGKVETDETDLVFWLSHGKEPGGEAFLNSQYVEVSAKCENGETVVDSQKVQLLGRNHTPERAFITFDFCEGEQSDDDATAT